MSGQVPGASEGAHSRSHRRIASIDVMRGLVMVVMLMDHIRETLYLHRQVTDPMTLTDTPAELYFSRLAAHFCAPVFVFLAGLSAWLYAHPAGGGVRSPAPFLTTRGLFLILLEVTVVTFAWSGTYHTLWLQVIWAIGLSMVALGLLVRLPYLFIGLIGFVIVFGHNLLTPISFAPDEWDYFIWTILHDRGFLLAEGPLRVKVSYPVLPWIGVIALGYFTGPLYARSTSVRIRRRWLVTLGICCWLLLMSLRGFNLYGETLPWVAGQTSLETLMSFFNFTKYPPSLDFLLITLGTAMLLLAALEPLSGKLLGALETLGSAPMFFYIIHLYALLILYRVLLAIFGTTHGDRFGVDQFWWVWLSTLVMAPLLYFPTKAFANFKRYSKNPLWRYF